LEFIELERYLKKLLKKKVDLVEKQGIRPQLRDIIIKEVVYVTKVEKIARAPNGINESSSMEILTGYPLL